MTKEARDHLKARLEQQIASLKSELGQKEKALAKIK